MGKALIVAGVAAAVVAGIGLGRGFHPLFWARGGEPAMTPDVVQQAQLSQQLHGAAFFFGDSQVEGFATTCVAPNSANFGVAGDTAQSLADRLPHYDLAGARLVVIEVGINDWGWGQFAHLAPGYRGTLAAVPAGIPVIALAIAPPAHGWRFGLAPSPGTVRTVNATIRTLCSERPRCVYLEPPLAGPDGYLRPGLDDDGEHLSNAGYAVWAASLGPLLR